MHHIQRKILAQLMYAPALGYAKMRPSGVESNHFAYHLDQLLREQFIVKKERSYTLTSKGLSLVDRVSHETMTPRMQPHIVTSLYITNEQDQMLVYQHQFQPYLGLYGPPQGRIHYEEHIADAASRELAEKTGLTDVKLTHRGIAYIQASKNGTEISKILAHVFTGSVVGRPEVASQTPKGHAQWKYTAELTANTSMPGFQAILALLSEHPAELFFTELETRLPMA